MNVYLAIITTALVVTQIIRTTQNAIQLRRQRKEIDKTIGWFKENDVSEKDFVIQREVFYQLNDWLKAQKVDDTDICFECAHWKKWKSFAEDPEYKWCDKKMCYILQKRKCDDWERKYDGE